MRIYEGATLLEILVIDVETAIAEVHTSAVLVHRPPWVNASIRL